MTDSPVCLLCGADLSTVPWTICTRCPEDDARPKSKVTTSSSRRPKSKV